MRLGHIAAPVIFMTFFLLPLSFPRACRPRRAFVIPDYLSGGHGGGAIPVPIPNTEVKPSCADDTALRGRESRWLPGFFFIMSFPL